MPHESSSVPPVAGLRCLVLGAGGFLGRALASALCDRGAVVGGLGHGARDGAAVDGRVRWTEADLADRTALRRALDGTEVVFHVLGPPVRDLEHPATAPHFVDAAETAALLEACRAAGVRKVVFASSGGSVYGIPARIPTPESAPAAPLSAYGAGCVAIERELERFRDRHGLDHHVLRIANAYGPGQSPLRGRGVVATMLFCALTGRPLEVWGSGSTARDFVHVDDVAAALIYAARYAGGERIMNVGSSRGRTLDEVVADVKEVLELPGAPVVVRPPRALDVPVSVLDTALITRATPWRPRVPWLHGLAGTAQWLRDAYGVRAAVRRR